MIHSAFVGNHTDGTQNIKKVFYAFPVYKCLVEKQLI